MIVVTPPLPITIIMAKGTKTPEKKDKKEDKEEKKTPKEEKKTPASPKKTPKKTPEKDTEKDTKKDEKEKKVKRAGVSLLLHLTLLSSLLFISPRYHANQCLQAPWTSPSRRARSS